MSGMVHRRTRRVLVLGAGSLVAVIAMGALGAPPSTSSSRASKATSCKAKQIAIAYRPRGRKTPATWCFRRGATPHSGPDAEVSIERLLASGHFGPKRLERLVPRLPTRQERTFTRARETQLRRTTTAATRARAAVAGPSTHSEGTIPAGPDQAGFGFFSETTSSSTDVDAERATVHTTHTSRSRHEVFGPKCPDFGGDVVTKFKIVISDVRSVERRGKRTTITTDARITGSLGGGFTDDFALRGPLKMDLDVVMETRVVTVIAVTGKVVSREPTSTRRVTMTGSVGADHVGSIESIDDAMGAMTITGGGTPKGRLTVNDVDESLALTTIGAIWLARIEAQIGFGKTVENAVGWMCVVAEAKPDSLTLDRGQAGSFTVTLHGLDDQRPLPTSSDARVFSGNLQLSPVGLNIHGPEGGTAFGETSGGGKSVAEVSVASRRGYAPTLKIPVDEPPLFVPRRYSGTFSGDADLSTGPAPVPLTATFSGSVVFAPAASAVPSLPGVNPVGSSPTISYHVESGSMHVRYSGTVVGGCHLLAEGQVDLLADPGAAAASPLHLGIGAPMTYSLRLGPPLTAMIPGAFTGCPNPADNKAITWPVATGIAAIIEAPPNPPLGPHDEIAGTNAGRIDASVPSQTWVWNLVPLAP